MKIGSVVYATDQGLGVLAKSFFDHGVVTDVLVVWHPHRTNHLDWYPGSPQTQARPFDGDKAREFIRGMDAMLFFETPFEWGLIDWCRKRGVRSYLMPMHECMPRQLPYEPDRFICPSLLDLRCYPDRSEFIPVPVETPWRLRTMARHFVHNAGHLGLRGRNGTLELLQAMRHVKSPLTLTVRSQVGIGALIHKAPHVGRDRRVTFETGTVPHSRLWDEGDVFVFSEKFNGLSLPLQEARAAGMLVMATDRFPMNQWLPTDPLIPVTRTVKACVAGSCRDYDEAVIDPRDIASKMDEWYGQDISAYSIEGREWAESMSWDSLLPRYMEALTR